MELLESARLFTLGIIKRIYWLIPALFLDPIDLLERVFRVNLDTPTWIGWLLIGLAVLVAAFLTYHDLRTQTQPSFKELKWREDQAKKKDRLQRIESILKAIPTKLIALRKKLELLIDNLDIALIDRHTVERAIIWADQHGENLRQTGRFSRDTYVSDSRHLLDSYGIGIESLVKSNAEVGNAVDEVDLLRSQIGDTELNGYIYAYIRNLYNISTVNFIVRCAGSSEIDNETRCSFMSNLEFWNEHLKEILTAINRRIEELLSGAKLT